MSHQVAYAGPAGWGVLALQMAWGGQAEGNTSAKSGVSGWWVTDRAAASLQAVTMTAKCGESNSAPIQLAVVKALLTFVTAEHFMVHGDCLMQASRTASARICAGDGWSQV